MYARLLWNRNPQIEIKYLSKYSIKAFQPVLWNHLSSDWVGNVINSMDVGICSGIHKIPHGART